jgi:hypothetical protein
MAALRIIARNIGFARQEQAHARERIVDRFPDHGADRGGSAVPVRVTLEHQAVVEPPVAGAIGAGGDQRALGGPVRRALSRAMQRQRCHRRVREQRGQLGEGGGECHDHGRFALGLHRPDRGEQRGVRRPGGLVVQPLPAAREHRRGDRRAIGEAQAVAQDEAPGQTVGGRLPVTRQPRHRHAEHIEAGQPLELVCRDAQRGEVGIDLRVEPANLGIGEPDQAVRPGCGGLRSPGTRTGREQGRQQQDEEHAHSRLFAA